MNIPGFRITSRRYNSKVNSNLVSMRLLRKKLRSLKWKVIWNSYEQQSFYNTKIKNYRNCIRYFNKLSLLMTLRLSQKGQISKL